MTYKTFKQKAGALMWHIYGFLEETGYNTNHNADRIIIFEENTESVYIKEWANKLLNMLDSYCTWANYMQLPFKNVGKIRKLESGQYALDDNVLTCGTPLEVFMYDEETEQEKWSYTTVEFNGKYYYFTCNGKKVKQGIFARMKH